MYKELSHETDEFYQFMMDRELFDAEAKKVKKQVDTVHSSMITIHHLFSQTSTEQTTILQY